MSARLTTDLLALDIRRLVRQGRLNTGTSCTVTWKGRSFSASIGVDVHANAATLRYSANAKHQCYDVAISTTQCHLGGQRHWWQCPRCDRRCAILYGGAVFICRKCAGLHYPTQHSNDFEKFIIRADSIRERLGWRPGIAYGQGPKPKGMHWKTYRGLAKQHERMERAICEAVARRFQFQVKA